MQLKKPKPPTTEADSEKAQFVKIKPINGTDAKCTDL